MTDPDNPPTTPGGPPAWVEEDPPDSPMIRLRERSGRLIAAVLAVFLVVPAGAWIIDAVVFSARGDAVATAVPELADAVALVTRLGCDGRAGTGSGFAITYDDRPALVTNRHVVQDAAQVGLRTLDGASGPVVEQVLLAPGEDVAVLLLDRPLGSSLGIGEQPRDGEEVRLVGFPGARPITTSGTVADVDGARTLLDFDVGPGASGAPVVDEDGVVVAQVVARRSDGSGVAISAPAVRSAIATVAPAAGC